MGNTMFGRPWGHVGAELLLNECAGGGEAIPRALLRYSEDLVGTPLDDVRVVQSPVVELLEVPAVAVADWVIVHPSAWAGFDDRDSMHLLVHELTHIGQQRAGRVPPGPGLLLDDALECEAELAADRAVRALSSANPERHLALASRRFLASPRGRQPLVLQAHPGSPIIRKALSYLGSRTAKAISKHIAKHTRRNFEKAIHSVFRNIHKIRPLVKQTLQEGLQLTEKFSTDAGLQVVEHAGVKLARQTSTTPGKYRWLLQKEFKTAIGTKGEKVLRIVLDMSGRIVTAFPADKILTLIGTVVGIDLISEGIANAAENTAFEMERLEKFKEMQRQKIDLWDFVPYIGAIWGGKLNEFEDIEMAFDRWIDQVVKDTVDKIEWQAKASLSNREAISEVVRIGMGLPLLLEHED